MLNKVYYNFRTSRMTAMFQAIKLWARMDNLDVDWQTGDLWVATHPVAYKTLQVMDDPVKNASPSQVNAFI